MNTSKEQPGDIIIHNEPWWTLVVRDNRAALSLCSNADTWQDQKGAAEARRRLNRNPYQPTFVDTAQLVRAAQDVEFFGCAQVENVGPCPTVIVPTVPAGDAQLANGIATAVEILSRQSRDALEGCTVAVTFEPTRATRRRLWEKRRERMAAMKTEVDGIKTTLITACDSYE